jgi:hypothetical protein
MQKIGFLGILKVTEDFCTDPHLHPDPRPDQLIIGTDPWIRNRIRIQIRTCIRTQMLRIQNTPQNNG